MSSRDQHDDGDKIPAIQVIPFPTDQIDPSPFQARKKFDPAGIKEIGDSIKEHGVLQPLIARVADPASGRLELVAGDRRRLGALLIGLAVVPVIVRDLSATQAEEIMLIENLQRVDLTESEEAHGYDRMLSLRSDEGAALYTVGTLAQKLGKDVSHVTARLKLLLCPKELVDAVDEGLVKVSTAMLVGRIPDPKARAECAREVLTPSHQQVPLNYEQTKELIRTRFVVLLDKKNFPLDDAMLVPVKTDGEGQRCLGGACTDCPFRSGNMEGVEARETTSAVGKAGGSTRGSNPNMCTLPKCHKMKMDAAWLEKKDKAQQNDQRVLDGEDAEKAFAGHNGDLAFDGDYVDPAASVADNFKTPSGIVYVSKSWKDALKGSDIKTVLARHPETRQVMQLYDRKEATAAVGALVIAEAEKAKQTAQEVVKTDDEQAREEAERSARAKEKEQAEVDKIALYESVGEIINGVTAKGVALDFYSIIFQMALTHSGADGMYFLGHYLGIELPKGSHSGRDYESEIIRIVTERAETANAWMAYIEVALFARQVKWNGINSDDLEVCLRQQMFTVDQIKDRAWTLYRLEKKSKKKPQQTPAAKGSSTDPISYSTDKEVDLTLAADERAKEVNLEKMVRPAWSVNDKDGYLEALLMEEVQTSSPNVNGVFTEFTEFACVVNKRVSMSISLVFQDARWAFGYQLMGGNGSGGRSPWESEKTESRSGAVHAAARSLSLSLLGNLQQPKKDTEARQRLQEVVEHILAHTVAATSAEAEKLVGIHDSKLGNPHLFTPEDIEVGAEGLAAKTMTITELIGPKPKPADKEAYNAWSRVRMKIVRASKTVK